ncbi:MAG TPA: hypothetical protein ENH31_04755 [Nitrospirae bacterium]|nr:hypothetical protein BMS3Abin10_01457 [bacterium BMS3Abin10]GBE39582.1 hypothetical protein BMS3Bbin08_02208 [bacterium BMS3Bbin08]HDH51662.1 hypothetical protein [Nitrospirota bacterium]HDK17759.1 hypothetical protein [Nitrospirota bacterium]HDK81864.1 hypothetical protein [Nitrospirota bacterium]
MIEKSFTSRFLFKLTGTITVGFVIALTVVYFMLPRVNVQYYFESISALTKTKNVLINIFILAGIVEVIYITAVVIFISILSSHKIAGPIYKLENILVDLAKGDLSQKLRFRSYDPLKDVELTFNNALKGFNRRFELIDRAYDGMEQARNRLDGSDRSIEDFRGKVDDVGKEIRKFKI